MTIQQLLDMEIGTKTGGFVFEVEHCHKMYDSGDIDMPWKHEVTLTDGKDEIKALVLLRKNKKFTRGNEIKVIVCELTPESGGGYGKMLLVHEHELLTQTADEYEEEKQNVQNKPKLDKWGLIVRGQVKHGQVIAAIEHGDIRLSCKGPDDEQHNAEVRANIIKWTDWVMSEKDIYNGQNNDEAVVR